MSLKVPGRTSLDLSLSQLEEKIESHRLRLCKALLAAGHGRTVENEIETHCRPRIRKLLVFQGSCDMLSDCGSHVHRPMTYRMFYGCTVKG